jgi:ABC-type uncharacterized transport system substrate-binding protein
LELLKETIPRLSRVSVLGTSSNPGNAEELREVEHAARALGVTLQYVDVPRLSPRDIETAFRTAANGRADAVLLMVSGAVSFSERKEIAEFAVKRRLPVIHEVATAVESRRTHELRSESIRL